MIPISIVEFTTSDHLTTVLCIMSSFVSSFVLWTSFVLRQSFRCCCPFLVRHCLWSLFLLMPFAVAGIVRFLGILSLIALSWFPRLVVLYAVFHTPCFSCTWYVPMFLSSLLGLGFGIFFLDYRFVFGPYCVSHCIFFLHRSLFVFLPAGTWCSVTLFPFLARTVLNF